MQLPEIWHQQSDRRRRSVLAENLDSLTLVGRCREQVLRSDPRGEIVWLADGNPAMRFDGRVLGAPSDSRSRAASVAEAGAVEGGVVVVFGAGVGHTIRELRSLTGATLLVYEPEPALLRSLLEAAPCDFQGVVFACDPHDVRLVWPSLAKSVARTTLVCTPGYDEAFPEGYRAIAGTVSDLVTNVQINENTYFQRSRTWIADIFENVPLAVGASPVLALSGALAGVPAFIVGAGPSLDKNGALLREAARRGLLLAVNTSAKAVARHGAVPHGIMCMESIDLTAQLRSLPFLDDVLRIFSLSGSPRHLELGKGPLLPFFENIVPFAPLRDLLGVEGLPVGASVSTAAFVLAERLGCSPIVFIGQDLAFPGGAMYAAGTHFSGSRVHVENGRIRNEWCDAKLAAHDGSGTRLVDSEPLLEVPAWGGKGLVPTSPGFHATRTWLEGAALAFREMRPELRLVNATEGGARMANFEEAPLGELLAGLPLRSLEPRALAAEAAARIAPLEREKLVAWAERQRSGIAAVRRAAVRVHETTDWVMARFDDPAAVGRGFSRLDRAEKVLRGRAREEGFVDGWATPVLQALERRQRRRADVGDARRDAEASVLHERDVARALVQASDELAERLAVLLAGTRI